MKDPSDLFAAFGGFSITPISMQAVVDTVLGPWDKCLEIPSPSCVDFESRSGYTSGERRIYCDEAEVLEDL